MKKGTNKGIKAKKNSTGAIFKIILIKGMKRDGEKSKTPRRWRPILWRGKDSVKIKKVSKEYWNWKIDALIAQKKWQAEVAKIGGERICAQQDVELKKLERVIDDLYERYQYE